MISEVDAEKIDQWLKKFQIKHGNRMVVDDSVMRDLAGSLCDDIPLGYEASHRLANWIFCHLNTPKISGELIENVKCMAERQEEAKKRLDNALYDYGYCTMNLVTSLMNLKGAD